MKETVLTAAAAGVNARLVVKEEPMVDVDYISMQIELPDRGLMLTIAGSREEVRDMANTILLEESDGDLPAAFDGFWG